MCRKIAMAKLTESGYRDLGRWRTDPLFCYIDDCLEGIYRLDAFDFRQPINLGQDRMVTINQLAEMIAEIAAKIERKHIDGPMGVRGRNSDNTLLRESLHWEPAISLERGLALTYPWIEAQLKARTLAWGAGFRAWPAERIGAALFVSALVAFSAWYLTPSLFRAWFYRSDEYAVIGEVLRFLHLDFRQHYFDMPDTPLMLASAAVWGVIYGLAGHGVGIDQFTLHHLARLFEMVRAASFLTGLLGIVLVYLLGSNLTNRAGGCVAAMLLAMCPVYGWTESTIRPEPPVVCLFILSIFCLQRARDQNHLRTRAAPYRAATVRESVPGSGGFSFPDCWRASPRRCDFIPSRRLFRCC